MAGRGTDIMLGGNPEYLSDTEKDGVSAERGRVKEAGGLFVLGTERHEARRIDNQLRGRSGRQGDPGASQFFLSLEDELMRLFGGERMQAIMDTMGVEEDMPIEARILSNTIETAQKKVEGRNFSVRKNVLQFDDVINRQREIIYGQRGRVLQNEDLKEYLKTMLTEVITDTVSLYIPDNAVHDNWNLDGLRGYFLGWLSGDNDFRYKTLEDLSNASKDEIRETLLTRAAKVYADKEAEYGSEQMREVERAILLKNVDKHWMNHIDNMDELKRGIHLRAYAQRDPVVEYRLEGFAMFDEMVALIKEDTVRHLMQFRIRGATVERVQVAMPTEMSHGGDESAAKKPVVKGDKIGRNDPCPCGSGKKYKKCCGA
jgi:preprotein translocase subunit SecA